MTPSHALVRRLLLYSPSEHTSKGPWYKADPSRTCRTQVVVWAFLFMQMAVGREVQACQ